MQRGMLLLGLAILAAPIDRAAAQTAPQQSGRPQSDPTLNQSPRYGASDLREYARMLDTALAQLREAIARSSGEPAANDQKAMTPARMDEKAAAQQAYDAVRRAPPAFRDGEAYREAERKVRENLARLSQPLRLEESNGAAAAVLSAVEELRRAVERG